MEGESPEKVIAKPEAEAQLVTKEIAEQACAKLREQLADEDYFFVRLPRYQDNVRVIFFKFKNSLPLQLRNYVYKIAIIL